MPRHFHHATVLSMIFYVDGLLGGYQIPRTLFSWLTNTYTSLTKRCVYKRVWQKMTRESCRQELQTTQVIMWLLHISQFSHLRVRAVYTLVNHTCFCLRTCCSRMSPMVSQSHCYGKSSVFFMCHHHKKLYYYMYVGLNQLHKNYNKQYKWSARTRSYMIIFFFGL